MFDGSYLDPSDNKCSLKFYPADKVKHQSALLDKNVLVCVLNCSWAAFISFPRAPTWFGMCVVSKNVLVCVMYWFCMYGIPFPGALSLPLQPPHFPGSPKAGCELPCCDLWICFAFHSLLLMFKVTCNCRYQHASEKIPDVVGTNIEWTSYLIW